MLIRQNANVRLFSSLHKSQLTTDNQEIFLEKPNSFLQHNLKIAYDAYGNVSI